jgi:hypothetical protein
MNVRQLVLLQRCWTSKIFDAVMFPTIDDLQITITDETLAQEIDTATYLSTRKCYEDALEECPSVEGMVGLCLPGYTASHATTTFTNNQLYKAWAKIESTLVQICTPDMHDTLMKGRTAWEFYAKYCDVNAIQDRLSNHVPSEEDRSVVREILTGTSVVSIGSGNIGIMGLSENMRLSAYLRHIKWANSL